MNLRGLDLNLLVILQALLDEAHVSRAARRVGLSQSAMSNALDRCRDMLGDPLLERAGPAMRLTPRAETLRGPLATILADIEDLVDRTDARLHEVRRAIHIVAADILAAALVRSLHAAVAKEAPGIDLSFHGWSGGTAALTQVEKGTVDVAVSVLPPVDPRHFVSEVVREEHYLLAMRAGHPLAADAVVTGWLDYPHVVVSAEGATHTGTDAQLAAAGLARRVGLTVPSFLLVPDLLRESDMLALLPSLCLTDERAAGLAIRPLPLPVSGFRLEMVRHRRNERDVAVNFVAGEIRRLLAN